MSIEKDSRRRIDYSTYADHARRGKDVVLDSLSAEGQKVYKRLEIGASINFLSAQVENIGNEVESVAFKNILADELLERDRKYFEDVRATDRDRRGFENVSEYFKQKNREWEGHLADEIRGKGLNQVNVEAELHLKISRLRKIAKYLAVLLPEDNL